MSTQPPHQTTPGPPTEATRVVWPLRYEPFAAAGWAIVVVAVAILGVWLSGDVFTAALVVTGLLLCLWRVWAPVKIHLGPRGVVEDIFGRRWRFSWRSIARYESRRDGLVLFASPEPSPLAPLRSLFVPWRGQREQLETVVDYYLAAVEEDAFE
ncbi:MAG: hypothetical protein NXI22_21140 [bacterium]|nr:hypothetical protein [bacterium]